MTVGYMYLQKGYPFLNKKLMVTLVLSINGQLRGNSIWLTDMVISYTAARKIAGMLLFVTCVLKRRSTL